MMLLALACLVLATTVGVAPSMRIERKASIRVTAPQTSWPLRLTLSCSLPAFTRDSAPRTPLRRWQASVRTSNGTAYRPFLPSGWVLGGRGNPCAASKGWGNSPHWPPCLNVPGARYRRGANALWTNFVTTPRTRPPPQPNGQAYSLPCPSQCATYLHFSSWGWRQR